MWRTITAITLSGLIGSLAATLLVSARGLVGNVFLAWAAGASVFTLVGAAGLAGLAALLRVRGTPGTAIGVILIVAGAISGEATGRVLGLLPGLGALYGTTTGLVLIVVRQLAAAELKPK